MPQRQLVRLVHTALVTLLGSFNSEMPTSWLLVELNLVSTHSPYPALQELEVWRLSGMTGLRKLAVRSTETETDSSLVKVLV